MKINEVNSIAIVGGGTSAWLTAAMVTHCLPHMTVWLIDKEVGTPVGVGEGTLLSFDKIMQRCGFEVKDWFFEIDATYKAGILFPGWGNKDDNVVWHPFLFPELNDQRMTLLDVWSNVQELDFKKYGMALYELSVYKDMVDLNSSNGYAFHIDASKLVAFLQKQLESRLRLDIIKSEVVDIFRNDDNTIDRLELKNGQHIKADLYVDCTGFKGLLNNKPDRVDLEGRLFCDTALATHVPYIDREEELHPFVISEQVEHGWVWNIPVQSRIGSGLVFSRKMTDIEEAKEFFVNYWDNRITKDQLKVIDWTPYYNKNIWHDNIVSIGLSAGFIEPLESTGVALIIAGIEQLVFALESRYYIDATVDYYNRLMANYFEDSIDFINMHYSVADRPEKFWQWVKETIVVSERQKFYERQMLRTDELLPVKGMGYMFCATNWIIWLIQLGFPLNASCQDMPKEQALEMIRNYYDECHSKFSNFMKHTDYIEMLKSYVK